MFETDVSLWDDTPIPIPPAMPQDKIYVYLVKLHEWIDVPLSCYLFIDLWIDGLVEECSICSALAMEILQFCTKPSICSAYCCIWYLR